MMWTILFVVAAIYVLYSFDDCFLNEHREPDPEAGKAVKPVYCKRF